MRSTLIIILMAISIALNAQISDSAFNLIGKTRLLNTFTQNPNMTVKPNQKINIVTPYIDSTTIQIRDISFFQLNNDGTLDTTFGNNGFLKLILDSNFNNYTLHTKPKITAQSTNKLILMACYYNSNAPATMRNKVVTIRLNTNGTIDSTYGNNGIGIAYNSFTFASSIKIITLPNDDLIISIVNNFYPNKSFLIKLKNNGIVDSLFGINGIATYNNNIYSLNLLSQPDGKILTCGYIISNNITNHILFRHNANGNIDSSFGNFGSVITNHDIYNYSTAIELQPDGKILVAGYETDSVENQNIPLSCFGNNIFATVERFLSDGKIDSSFNNFGYFQLMNSTPYPNNIIQFTGIHYLNNKIIATGSYQTSNSTLNYLLVGFNMNGTLDSSFANNGIYIYIDSANMVDWGLSSSIQNLNQILIIGRSSSYPTNNRDILIARFLTNLSLGTIDSKINNFSEFAIFPNPINETATISYKLNKSQKVTFQLIDMNGRIISTFFKNQFREQGINNHNLMVPNTIKQGNYILSIKGENFQSSILITKN